MFRTVPPRCGSRDCPKRRGSAPPSGSACRRDHACTQRSPSPSAVAWPSRGASLDAVEKDEQVGGTVATVFAIVSLGLSWRRGKRLSHLTDQLRRALVEADHRMFRIWLLRVQIKHVFHARDI